jgi:hypothetical protein
MSKSRWEFFSHEELTVFRDCLIVNYDLSHAEVYEKLYAEIQKAIKAIKMAETQAEAYPRGYEQNYGGSD